MATAEYRPAPRFELAGGRLASLQGMEPLSVHNLSGEGLLIESVAPIVVGSILVLQLIHGTHSAQALATVRHQAPMDSPGGGQHYLVGLEFIDLDTQARAWIDQVLHGQPERRNPDAA
jgi:hypothetical protein